MQLVTQVKYIFEDELQPRELDLEVRVKDEWSAELLEQHKISLDDHRFKILLYNLLRNSVSHTNGGYIRVTLKLLDEIRRTAKLEKISKNQREMSKRRK